MMKKRPEHLAIMALVVLVVLLVAVGLNVAGGPGQARAERHDRERLADLHELAEYVECLADQNAKTLPDDIRTATGCNPDISRNDPYSGTPYVYERVSESSFRLCAEFEAPEVLAARNLPRLTLEGARGCLQFSYIR